MSTSNPEINDLDTSDLEVADPNFTDVEELLSAAGIDFTVVQRCPYPQCVVCTDSRLSAAA